MPKITIIGKKGERHEIDAPEGYNLMTVARQNNLEVEGACCGAMACSTCHMIIDPAWYGRLVPPTTDETDMLDLAQGLTHTSRLGCQIKVTEALNGLTVSLPPGR
ncbi:MAG: 2Fe-2S iron-sulfur cluster-binding protein [Alphaproteobacteria bacterium]|nr:2Fe-2S iron-sulfur cluster-binding protein [Alphaproteobacteria bacterium]